MQKTISKRCFTMLITVEAIIAALFLILPVKVFAADDIQTVTTDYADLWTGDITLEKGVTTKWYINVPAGTTLNGCGSTVQIPGLLDDPITLTEGENFIYEFTPDSSDDILFACSMGAGCHKNYIRVTGNDDTAELAEESAEEEKTDSDAKEDNAAFADAPKTASDETDDGSVSKVTTDYASLWTGDIALEKGVTTKWYINVPAGTALKGCGATVQIPGLLDEPITLTEGENFIYEFTPDSSDDILFACSMGAGCHKNYIQVTGNDDTAKLAEESAEEEKTDSDAKEDNEVSAETSETVSDSVESNPKTGNIGFAGALAALIGSVAVISVLNTRRNRSHK
jgi:hypothetical protein